METIIDDIVTLIQNLDDTEKNANKMIENLERNNVKDKLIINAIKVFIFLI